MIHPNNYREQPCCATCHYFKRAITTGQCHLMVGPVFFPLWFDLPRDDQDILHAWYTDHPDIVQESVAFTYNRTQRERKDQFIRRMNVVLYGICDRYRPVEVRS